MNSLFVYLVQSGICLSVLYLIYWIFMRKDTFFSIHRIYLMISAFVSFFLPLLQINLHFQGTKYAYVHLLEAVTIGPEKLMDPNSQPLNIAQLIRIVYLSGIGIFFGRFLIQIIRLGLLIIKYGITQKNRLNLVITDQDHTPFVFFSFVFLGKKNIDKETLNKILIHEKVHIRQYHSVDIIFLELFTIIQWFNPIIWMYKNATKNIHEYIADEGVLNNGIELADYQQLLLNQAVGINISQISNNLRSVRIFQSNRDSLLKRRLIMMTKSRTQNVMLFKLIFILPLSLLMALVFSSAITGNVVAQHDHLDTNQVSVQDTYSHQEDEVFTVVEKEPEYPGGEEARIKFFSNTIKYPEEARKNGISGTVYISYIVEKNGKISNVDLVKGVHESLDGEAMRVVELMPAWNPGIQRGKPVRVKYVLPVQFKLDKGVKKTKDPETDVPPPPEKGK